MKFPDALLPGRLLRRYKRFLADVELVDGGGEVVTVHCPNPGGMIGLKEPGLPVWLSRSRNPARKLPLTLELVELPSGLVGINTNAPNSLVAEALAEDRVPELAGYESARREVRYGVNSRIDILMEHPERPPCYVEIKNVHLERMRDGERVAAFPDAVTTRGQKHLRELETVVAAGGRAVMFYVIQRPDCVAFTTAPDFDPDYDKALRHARAAGVETICYDCDVSVAGITLRAPRPIRLDDAAT